MNRRNLIKWGASAWALLGLGVTTQSVAQDWPPPAPSAPPNLDFLAKAETAKPALLETLQSPLGLIEPIADATHQLGWRIQSVGDAADIEARVLNKGESFIIDFGGHRTGYLSFDLVGVGRNVDAPARMRFVFGEVISDVAEPFHPYTGTLSSAWLPEEVVTIDYLPQRVNLPRRYAFRFVKVEIIDTSSTFGVSFKNVQARAVTSATGELSPLPPHFPDDLKQMDVVAPPPLRDCMQTVFEDGPRRDQRLWTGDLRLQALTSYVSLQSNDLVKRSLYLLAAFPRADGLLPGAVFELPEPSGATDFPYDYSVLFTATLADYVDATGDTETGLDLWPTALRQMEILKADLGPDHVYALPRAWVFIDWHDSLDRTASMHAIYLYGLKRMKALAGALGRTADITDYDARIRGMEKAALNAFYDKKARHFVSGPDRQVSLASQAWMTIAGVGSKSLQATALRSALGHAQSVRPRTPYLNHHVVEALFLSGCNEEAVALMRAYWGGMLEAGADTFWEAYAPENPRISPYGDFHINSFCHAWSCTPSYLLRTYGAQIAT